MKSMIASILLSMMFGPVALATQWESKDGSMKFHAKASPGALSINGEGAAPGGKIEVIPDGDKHQVSGSLKIKLESLKTGITLRDSHMREKYLEAGKFPEAMLVLSKQNLPKSGPGPFEGDLILHGVKHRVSGVAEFRVEGNTASVKADFPVRLQEHGITIPSFAGITVSDEVKVETDFKLTEATKAN